MKYISIDTETTGLDPEFCQLLSLGLIIEDTNNILPYEKLPKFHAIIVRDNIEGEEYALNLNAKIIDLIIEYNISNPEEKFKMSESEKVIFTTENSLVSHIQEFLLLNHFESKITIAGKNYIDFDKKFLEKIPHWNELNIHRRVIDPATSFVDWKIDTELPNLALCKERAGIKGEVKHDAIEDSWDVIQVLRTKY